MAYPNPVARRRRRRRAVWLLALASVLAIAVILVFQLRSERRELATYLDAAFDITESYRTMATGIETIITELEERERPTLLATLDQSSRAAEAAHERLLDQSPPASAGAANGFLRVASAAWRDGLLVLEDTLGAMLDGPETVEGVALLDSAFLNFAVGDRAYAGFLSALDELDAGTVTLPFSEVQFIPQGAEIAYQGDIVASRIEGMAELSAVHDVAIADVAFVPTPVGNQDGVPIVPFDETFEVLVTVKNRGNEPEADISVSVTIVRGDSGELPIEQSITVDALEPEEARTLTFSELPVVAGGLYELVAVADLATDQDPVSNELRRVFLRNEPPEDS